MFKRRQKDLLGQADPDRDCIPAPPFDPDEELEHQAEWEAVGSGRAAPAGPEGAGRPGPGRPRIYGRAALVALERIALPLESLFNRLIGAQSLNPFYHTGTIAVFLLLVVAATGLYLTIFYVLPGVGTGVAYGAVAAVDGHWLGIGRIMRGVHRYASGAAVIATLLHTLRTLFQDRFRGARWLAWVSGMVMLAAMWFEGLTGYWLVWDERAQLILETAIQAITAIPSFGVPFALSFITNQATDQTWLFFLILLFVHIALFPLLGLFYWFHILRLSRAKFLPPRYFMIALGAILLAVALAFPATSALEADLGRLPGRLTIDPFFLLYLPATIRANPAYFWGATALAFALLTAVPWLLRGREPGKVVIDKDLCTGCTKCAEDCPYNAIVMLPRTAGGPHKLIAQENPALCVSCGICVGSCDGMAVNLTDLAAKAYYQSMLAGIRAAGAAGPVSVVFTCERHEAHEPRVAKARQKVIAVPCVAALHPNVVGQAIGAGAAEVAVVGCPLDDCAQREGNLWMAARLNRTRLPRLKRAYENAPIRAAWLPPNERRPGHKPGAAAPENVEVRPAPRLKPAHYIRGGLLLAALLAVQALFTDVAYQPYAAGESLLQLGMRNEGQLRQQTAVLTGPELAQLTKEEQVKYLEEQQAEGRFPTRLRLEVDGQVLLDKTYPAMGLHREGSSVAYERFFIPPGDHALRLSVDDSGQELQTAIDQVAHFGPGQVRAITFDRVSRTFTLK